MAAAKTKAKSKSSQRRKTSKSKAAKAQLDKDNVKDTVKKVVETQRELKYNYPEDMKDPMERKRFRQQVRNKLYKYERDIPNLKGKELTDLTKEYNDYRKEVLLVP